MQVSCSGRARLRWLVTIWSLTSAAPSDKHGVNMNAGNQWDPGRNAYLAHMLAGTGVRWAYVPVIWAWAEPSEFGTTYWGPRASRFHDYHWDGLDATVHTLAARGVNIVFQLRSQPGWAGGSGCDVIAGTPHECAKILRTHRAKFRDNFYDFAYHLASRYPYVKYWSIGNEPNLDVYFSPEPPLLYQSPAAEYMDLMLIPAAEAIRSVIPDAIVFGPDLFTCFDRAADCTQRDRNWGYRTNWLHDWVRVLLLNWPDFFPIFTITNYSSSDRGVRHAVGALWNLMVAIERPRPIWTTEFNFGDGTCPGHSEGRQRKIANLVCKTYKYMTWQRAFYFDLSGNGCFSLLMPDGTPKSFLYSAFQAIVAGAYECR